EISVSENENTLAASPLGIYNYEETTYQGKTVKPTALPGSFLPLPAHGITTIAWAEHLKGETPIDAIRVRVAGIDGYTVEAAEKIKQVAKDIEEKGFQVDIVAGASHQELKIDVEGLGTVLQPATTLGAADTILQSWNVLTLTISTLFLLIGGLTFWNRISLWLQEQRKDEELLLSVGWQPKEAAGFIRNALFVILAIAVVISAAAISSLAYYDQLQRGTTGFYIGGVGAAFLLTAVAFSLRHHYPKLALSKAKQSLTNKNLRYYRSHLYVVFMQIVMSSILSVYVFSSFMLTEEKTTFTRLGQYVHLQTEGLQLLLLSLAYLLTVMTLAEALRNLWKERSEEIRLLNVIGWSRRKIVQFLMGEVMRWSSGAVVIGLLFSVLLFYWTIGLKGVISWCLLFGVAWLAIVIFISWWTVREFTRKYVYVA
ncbi:putative ABC transport system permease protein, partial [Evansella caseinilytica]